jgi:hypothetical protein
MRGWWVAIFILFPTIAGAQMSDDDVDGLTVQILSPTSVKLRWKAELSVPCKYQVTYSVFRSKNESFDPSEKNRVAAGIKSNSVVLADRSEDAYFHVRSVHTSTPCASKPLPGYHGAMTVHPIGDDQGGLFVSLRTKWRSETAQKGSLSYIVTGIYLGPGDEAAFYARIRRCTFSLRLLDGQGFMIKEIAIDFIGQTSQSAKITGVEANDIATLTNEQYRDFGTGENWNIGWACPGS